jgi:N-methylhydantoinase B/oxoprolinase/acetone carboxylase alpha subunit
VTEREIPASTSVLEALGAAAAYLAYVQVRIRERAGEPNRLREEEIDVRLAANEFDIGIARASIEEQQAAVAAIRRAQVELQRAIDRHGDVIDRALAEVGLRGEVAAQLENIAATQMRELAAADHVSKLLAQTRGHIAKRIHVRDSTRKEKN